MQKHLLTTITLATVLSLFNIGPSLGYDTYLYNNLQRSRDALLGQRAELERAHSEVFGQIDRLQAKAARIDSYLKQVDDSLRNVDGALNNVK